MEYSIYEVMADAERRLRTAKEEKDYREAYDLFMSVAENEAINPYVRADAYRSAGIIHLMGYRYCASGEAFELFSKAFDLAPDRLDITNNLLVSYSDLLDEKWQIDIFRRAYQSMLKRESELPEGMKKNIRSIWKQYHDMLEGVDRE